MPAPRLPGDSTACALWVGGVVYDGAGVCRWIILNVWGLFYVFEGCFYGNFWICNRIVMFCCGIGAGVVDRFLVYFSQQQIDVFCKMRRADYRNDFSNTL